MASKEEALRACAGKRLACWEIEGHGEIVFRQPSRPEYMRLMSQVQDDKVDSAQAMLGFVKSCAVWPEAAAIDAVLDDYPAMLNEVGGALQDLAKPAAKAVVKKG